MICDECETVSHCLKNGCVPKQPSKDEALKLALEALEELNNTNSYWWQEVDKATIKKIDPAITAIKQALTNSALDRMAENARELGLMPLRGGDYEPAQQSRSDVEPVGEVCGYYERGFDEEKTRYGKLYNQDLPLGIKLYTTQPAAQQPWVGLTDEEVINVMPDDDTPISLGEAFSKFAKLIEAKLKEKNT